MAMTGVGSYNYCHLDISQNNNYVNVLWCCYDWHSNAFSLTAAQLLRQFFATVVPLREMVLYLDGGGRLAETLIQPDDSDRYNSLAFTSQEIWGNAVTVELLTIITSMSQ